MRVMVIGASGFIGSHLCPYLLARRHRVVASSRAPHTPAVANSELENRVLDLAEIASSQIDFSEIDCVVYLAARAHVMNEDADDPLYEYRRINSQAAVEVARQAAVAGVGRFIYLSSIGVNGVHSQRPFRESDTPQPLEPYAQSKLEAEQALRRSCAEVDMELVLLRPVLVYGRDAPGNFSRLLNLVSTGRWLPLAAIDNRRSLLAVDNLVQLIELCLHHPRAANQLFLVADGDDLSTPALVRAIAEAVGVPARLLPVPTWLLRLAGKALGKSHEIERLCGSLQADIGKARDTLGWQPGLSLREALRKMVAERAGEDSDSSRT